MSKFPKAERLNSKKRFAQLIAVGRSLHIYPLRTLWLVSQSTSSFQLQVAFSVPKRKFRKAVNRNRIKRMMREAFRLEKEPFKEALKDQPLELYLLMIYKPKSEVSWQIIREGMQETLSELKNEVVGQTR